MKKIDLNAVLSATGSSYPAPFNSQCANQASQRLARYAGLTQFGVNLTIIHPGTWSSQRHWHSHEDEFVWVVEGELTLVTNTGEEILRAGDCAAFPAGDSDGHQLINRTGKPAKLLEIGTSSPLDLCTYSDIDMLTVPAGPGYTHRDGTPYPE